MWLDFRFPQLAPSDIWRALIRVVLVLAIGQLVPARIDFALVAGMTPATALLSLQGMLAGAR